MIILLDYLLTLDKVHESLIQKIAREPRWSINTAKLIYNYRYGYLFQSIYIHDRNLGVL